MNTFTKIFSAELEGVDARLIDVEVDLLVGLHSFNIVGLADKALSEARERVNAALKNSDIKPPNKENRKITVNLAPADIKKTGSQYDLAIAVGYALSTGQIKPFETTDKVFVGELALDGALRPVSGALNIAERARAEGFRYLFVPYENATEASAISGIAVIPVRSLKDAVELLETPEKIKPHIYKTTIQESALEQFAHIKGHEAAKRALMIAAAGGHNLLMVGPPGTGKSLLAEAMVSVLPALTPEEAIEITKIWSAAGLSRGGLCVERPFRAPHHTASAVSVVGGGSNPRPGEISLAHRGVLFLDEFPEFQRNILESLREPMESGEVRVARAKATLAFPARFTLVAAMNPCPCGYFGDKEKECTCTGHAVSRYEKKISGPLLDRIDIQLTVPRISAGELMETSAAGRDELSAAREHISQARKAQKERFSSSSRTIFSNSELNSAECEACIPLDTEGKEFMRAALTSHFISPRGYFRILKVARTIADLERTEDVKKEHLSEAFGYRLKQRE